MGQDRTARGGSAVACAASSAALTASAAARAARESSSKRSSCAGPSSQEYDANRLERPKVSYTLEETFHYIL